jgi:ABC-type antimicrobial peptide transport system permease subunit
LPSRNRLAVKWATGWSDTVLGRLATYEAIGIGALGGIAGAGLGLAGAAAFLGGVTQRLLWTVGIAAAVGVALAALAAIVPALLQRRVPVALLLAED